MKRTLRLCLGLAGLFLVFGLHAAPLRVFIRAGVKTHGPNQHDHPRFLADGTQLLKERGVQADGSMEFPTATQLENTDVLVIFAADGMKIEGDNRANTEKFLRRGGGLVVIHDGVVAGDQWEWAKKVQGGAWRWDGDKKTIWHEGDVGVYFVDQKHPITQGISNFDWKDEVYNQIDMAPDAHVLATSFIDVFNIWPQLWTYEKTWEGGTTPYRCFVSIPGHEYDSFLTPHYRAILLRGIAWAGKRSNVDEFCSAEELASLRYPKGGPTPAREAVKHINLHPEFNVTLAADENIAEKIMSVDWDPQGRMWVIETPEYPGGRDINGNDSKITPWRTGDPEHFPVGGKEKRRPNDRVSMLEDTDGDGIMDKKTVFADGLELPTSLVFYKDGVIVTQAPDILWIRDTDGDGKADKIEKLYTGFGTFDTHAVINNLRWGPDGWIYGAVGYTRGKVVSPDGTKNFGEIAAGIYRFRPDGSMLEQVAAGGCNTWGCEVAPDNEIIFSTATCGEPICHVVIPEPILARGNVGGMKAFLNIMEENKIYPPFQETREPYVQIDWVGQWTAAAGACIYDGGAWPDKWAPKDHYSFFMSEATMHLFHHEFLDPTGPTYHGRKEEGRRETHFATSTDYWFRPIHSRVGPDGALYLVDFYNQIAVHNDTRGPAHGARNAASRPDRDHHFTRLYRIQAKEAKALPAFKLDRKNPEALIEALSHPNGWVRTTANRLLAENLDTLDGLQERLGQLIMDADAPEYGRIHALWLYATLARGHDVVWNDEAAQALLEDSSPAVRKNAVRVIAELVSQDSSHLRHEAGTSEPIDAAEAGLIARLKDSNDRVRIYALMALGDVAPTRATADAVVAAWPTLKDRWLESAAVGAASKNPGLYLEAVFGAKDPAFVAGFVPHLGKLAGQKATAQSAASLVKTLAGQPAALNSIKAIALESFIAGLSSGVVPTLDDTLKSALQALLSSEATAGATLPLVARWDPQGQLGDSIKPAVAKASAQLRDASLSDDARGQIAANLVGIRRLDSTIIPAVASLLGTEASPALQKRVIAALGSVGEGGPALVESFSKLSPELIEPAFGEILKRTESTMTFIMQIEKGTISTRLLGPARIHRLRTYGNESVAKYANDVVDRLAGPEQKEKDALLAKLTPDVVKPGNAENGHKLFTQNCAGCHIFKKEGRNLAPNLTGMGAHGPADLLVHIVDPNRLVEPNFVSVSVETKDGTSYEGIIDRQNANELVLRDASGDHTLRTADIKSRASTGRSLMPEGFEALGGDGLRDLLAYICADEIRFRIIDLTRAFTVNNNHGMYITQDDPEQTVTFRRYGLLKAGDIPFDVINPEKVVANTVVLKGGSGFAKTLPQKVEVKVGVSAQRLHFLGGVAGWGYPFGGEDMKGKPAARITLYFTDGATEEIALKNGVEIADYIGDYDVPGSKGLPSWVNRGQIRWFSRDVQHSGVIDRLSIESYDNQIAPTFFGITAEVGDPSAVPAATPVAAPAAGASAKPRSLIQIVGGGSSHDFGRWWGQADTALLNELPGFAAQYTENPNDLLAAFKTADVLYLSHNQATPNPAVRAGIFDHVHNGKGLVLVHAANWYNWSDWPEYNKQLVSGGTHGHDRYGEFEVTLEDVKSPILDGMPKNFTIKDELYHFEPDATGAPRLVLATGKSPIDGKVYPVVWITQSREGRIVCITLGHDGAAHDGQPYQRLLKNAITWAAGR